MFRILMLTLALGLFATAMTGCRAEGEIDTVSGVQLPQ